MLVQCSCGIISEANSKTFERSHSACLMILLQLRWCRRLHGSMQSQMFYTFDDTTYDKVSSDLGAAACETYHLHNLKHTNLHILVTSSFSCAPQGNSQQQSKCQCSNKCPQCNITKATCQVSYSTYKKPIQ